MNQEYFYNIINILPSMFRVNLPHNALINIEEARNMFDSYRFVNRITDYQWIYIVYFYNIHNIQNIINMLVILNIYMDICPIIIIYGAQNNNN